MPYVNQILIVDDSPTIRRMVKASLAALSGPCEFVEAASGLEAIERLALGPIELMVLDLNMPDMHGLEVLKFVRGHAAFRLLPVIVLSSSDEEKDILRTYELGVNSYILKPTDFSEFTEAARQVGVYWLTLNQVPRNKSA